MRNKNKSIKFGATKPLHANIVRVRYLQRRIVMFAQTSTFFSAFWLLNTSIELENNPYYVYWDRNDELQPEQIQKIFHEGYEGGNEVECEIYENCMDYIQDGMYEQIKEEIKSAKSSDLLCSFIERIKEEEDSNIEDFYELFESEILDEVAGFDALLSDYTSYDMNMDDLYRNSDDQDIKFEVDLNDILNKEMLKQYGLSEDSSFDDSTYTFVIENVSPSELAELGEKMKEKGASLTFNLMGCHETIYFDGDIVRPDVEITIPIGWASAELERHSRNYAQGTNCSVLTAEEAEGKPEVKFADDVVQVQKYLSSDAIPQVGDVAMGDICKVYFFANKVNDKNITAVVARDGESLFGYADGEWCEFTLNAIELSEFAAKEINPNDCFITVDGEIVKGQLQLAA